MSASPERRRNFMRALTVLLVALATGPGNAAGTSPSEAPGQIQEGTLTTTVQHDVRLRYLLFLPRGYGREGVQWPMILYLHGAMGRGEDFDKLSWYPLPRLLREPGREIPFVVLMPQCPEDQNWMDDDELIALVDSVMSSHAVDPDRVYLAGYSMGAMGAWHLAYAHPDRFAALAAMSGFVDPFWATRLKDTAVWVFHGAKDDRVPPRESEQMVKALTRLGADVRFTLDPERGHSPPTDEEHMRLFDWFLEHRRAHPSRTHHSETPQPGGRRSAASPRRSVTRPAARPGDALASSPAAR